MNTLDVVGLGLATLDVLVRLQAMPTWERTGSLSAFGFDGGGPVGTACVAVSRLGANVGYVGTAGTDLCAELKVRSLLEKGVDISRLVRRDQPENQIIMVYVHEETGERIFSGLKDLSANPLRVSELDREYITSARYLHLDGFHHEAALQAAKWMHAAGKYVMLDGSSTCGPISPEMRALVAETDILICGSGFGPALTGEHDLWQAGKAMVRMGPRIVVQTEGKDGSYTVTPDDHFHTPAFEVKVLDTTGAGDVFHGAYLVGLLKGWNLKTITLFATAVSALKCAKLGGREGIPAFDDVLSFLRERGTKSVNVKRDA